MTSVLAFEIIEYLGAAYLIFFGISALLEKSNGHDKSIAKEINPQMSFRQGSIH
jgi:threonine/homoserine/homoserine lactone efflux protein